MRKPPRAASALLAVAVAIGVLLTYCTRAPDEDGKTEAAELGGTVRCEAEDGAAEATGLLFNRAKSKRAFDITVEWYDIDGTYYTGGSVRTQPLPPNVATQWVVTPDSPFMPRSTCDVVEVREVKPREADRG